jgi:dual specificity MAP kinase phosphatase
MAFKVTSLFTALLIELQRIIDHLWRKIHGLPQLKRSMITPQLFLGGQYSFRGVHVMEKIGITAVVSMRERPVQHEKFMGTFKVLHLPTKDHHAPSLADLHKGVVFIQNEVKNGGKVYIHCHFGEGRGPSMIIAYLIFIGMTYDDAFAMVKKVRPFISPNSEQIARLRAFEKSLTEKHSSGVDPI